MIYIFDIDGTLSDASKRIHFINGPTKDWDSFYDHCIHDDPLQDTVDILLQLQGSNEIILITGRDERVRGLTKDWLDLYGIRYDSLYMRPTKNYIPDYQLKKKIFELQLSHRYDDIAGVFEDRQAVVDMWRALGLTCYQVAPGDF